MTLLNGFSRFRNWWTRPSGGLEVLWLAIPLIISAGSVSLMNFVDRMLLLKYDPDAISAAMNAGLLYFSLISLPNAIAAYTNTFVSQYNGSHQYKRIGPSVWQGIGFGLLMMPFFIFSEPLLGKIFELFKHEAHLLSLERSYLKVMLYASGAAIASEAAASFFYGREKMMPVMIVNIFCLILNGVLDVFWIYGYAGFPEWGIAGAAAATAVSQWVRLVILVVWMFLADGKNDLYAVRSGFKFDFQLMKRIIRFGGESGLQASVDVLCFTFFLLLIGGLGSVQANASTVAFTMNNFTFMPLVGTGIAVMSLVGNQLGENRPDLAQRGTITALVIGIAYAGMFGLAYLIVPESILQFCAWITEVKDFDESISIAVTLLRLVSAYLLFDGCCIVLCSALKGAGDTKFVMIVTWITAPILPLACLIGIFCFGMGVIGCWVVMTVFIFSMAFVFLIRFRGGKWKNMRVIEMKIEEEDKI